MQPSKALLPRSVAELAGEYLRGFRVVVLSGPRQAGKTTLMHQLAGRRSGEIRNLDEQVLLDAARFDPTGFTAADSAPVYIDEVQRGGDTLVRAVKTRVDASHAPGQFVLAGSMRFLSVPTLQESLAGRAGVLEVWPFSQGELCGVRERFLDLAFESPETLRSIPALSLDRRDYLEVIVHGGFPEPSRIESTRVRAAWFANYVRAVVERDIREMARVNQPSAASIVLRGLASLSGQLLVTNTLANRAELSRATVDRYTELLEAVFLIQRLRPWSRNPLGQAVKHPKVHLVDTGLLCHLLGTTVSKLTAPTAPSLGPVVETLVVTELFKQASWSETAVRLYHYRDARGHSEVDVVVENDAGRVVGVEVKASETVAPADFHHLRGLQARLRDDFVHGFVVYLGRHVLSFGEGLTAIPLGVLWYGDPTKQR